MNAITSNCCGLLGTVGMGCKFRLILSGGATLGKNKLPEVKDARQLPQTVPGKSAQALGCLPARRDERGGKGPEDLASALCHG